MSRPIATTLVAQLPFSMVIALAAQRLRRVQIREGALGLRLRLFGPTVPYAPTRMVAVATSIERDATDGTRRHEALRIELSPQAGWPAPRFETLLTARPHGSGVRLRLETEYEAPLGVTGRTLDFIWGRLVAAWTMRGFLETLRTGLEEDWRERKTRYPSIAALNARGTQDPPERSSAS
jgi:hypothetical protein